MANPRWVEELVVSIVKGAASVEVSSGDPGPPIPMAATPLDEFRRLTVAQFEAGLNRVARAFLDVLAKEGLECENVGVVRTLGLEFQIIMVPAYETSFCLYRPEGNATFIAVQGLGREPDEVAGVLLRMVGELLRAGAQGEG